MNKIHCSLSYHETPVDQVKTFAMGIITGFYGNPLTFTVLPKTQVEYLGLIDTYEVKRVAYENGGSDQKGDFLMAKSALMNATDLIAHETDLVANGDKAIVILAGFSPTKAPGESTKPGQCVVTVKRGLAGELISSCAKVEGAKQYGCFMIEGGPLPEGIVINADGRIVWEMEKQNPTPTPYPTPNPDPGMPPGPGNTGGPSVTGVQVDFTMQREKHFLNLKHDVTYYFYYYAVNATGVGSLSEGVSMVCW